MCSSSQAVEHSEYSLDALGFPLQELGFVDEFSFRSDRARSKIVWKWMVSNKYMPGNAVALAAQREELRQTLGFKSQEFGQKLGWFLNKEFKRFKDQGLVSVRNDGPEGELLAIYHDNTQLWLSSEWDGDTFDQTVQEKKVGSSRRRTTSAAPKRLHLKYVSKRRSVPTRTPNGPKRQNVQVVETHTISADLPSSTETEIEDHRVRVGGNAPYQEESPDLDHSLINHMECPIRGATKENDSLSDHSTPTKDLAFAMVTANMTQPDMIAPLRNDYGSAQTIYSHSPYSTQQALQSHAATSEGAESTVRQQEFRGVPKVLSASPCALQLDGQKSSTSLLSDQIIAIEYNEATLLRDCFLGCLCLDAIRKGEYQDCIGLISEYEYGWWESYLANFTDSKIRDAAKVEAEQQLYSSQSPLKSRQDFRNFLNRWRRLRSTMMPLVVGVPAEVRSTMQLQSNFVSPYLYHRRHYDLWLQELETCRKALSSDQQNRQILEQGISELKRSIDEVELLSNLARTANENHRSALLQLREEMKKSKEVDLQVLESEIQTLQGSLRQKETEIETLCQKISDYILSAKSMLGDLVDMVNFISHLPEVDMMK